MVKPLHDQVAVISGAAKGIGLATATRLASDGAHVIALDLPQSDFAPLEQAVAAQGRRLVCIGGDVRAPEDWAAAALAAVSGFGRIDVLVNSAGVAGPFAPIDQYPIEAFDAVLGINLKGSWLGIRATAAELRKTKGRIVNISSTAGLGGGQNTLAYTTSKHAVIGLTKLAAVEMAGAGVRVNVVCPSPTNTDMMRQLEVGRSDDEIRFIRARFENNCPMGRYGEPEEIAAAIAFLAGPESSFITGAVVSVDGGVKAK
jgi:NAD(P)-dependent dehydrogenase (short-subunit alcohol dehydrogenase family)